MANQLMDKLFQELINPSWFNLTIGNRLCSIDSLLPPIKKIFIKNKQLMASLVDFLLLEVNKPEDKDKDIYPILEFTYNNYQQMNERV